MIRTQLFWILPSKNQKHHLVSTACFLRNAQGYLRRHAWPDLRTELLSTFCEQIFVQHLLICWPVYLKPRSRWWSGNGSWEVPIAWGRGQISGGLTLFLMLWHQLCQNKLAFYSQRKLWAEPSQWGIWWWVGQECGMKEWGPVEEKPSFPSWCTGRAMKGHSLGPSLGCLGRC